MHSELPNTVDKIFCIVPWMEVHIDADGTYGTCGAQSMKKRFSDMGDDQAKYNVATMTIDEFVESEYQRRCRKNMILGKPNSLCEMCYHEETVSGESKRTRELTKSSISHINFYPSFNESPDKELFELARVDNNINTAKGKPNSFHLSIGNECNLSCKMCSVESSSGVATILRREGLYSGPIIRAWSKDEEVWNRVANYITSNENIQFVHIIGGEPLLSPRFEDLIDRLIAAGQTNIYLGFTTNGTLISDRILNKLSSFRYVDVGISIETSDALNNFIRSGSNIDVILKNIDKYLEYRDTLNITIRAVPSALSVHTLDDLYRWCIPRKLDILTNILCSPAHLQIRHLPDDIKDRLLTRYSAWEFSPPAPIEAHHRNSSMYKEHIDLSIRATIAALRLDRDEEMTTKLYSELNRWGWTNNPLIMKYFETGSTV